MSLVDRAKNILLKPAAEWEVIAKEPATFGGLFVGYLMILALIPRLSDILFGGLFGMSIAGAAGGGLVLGLVLGQAVIKYALDLALMAAMVFIVNALAPSFGGKQDMNQSAKLMIYASTPVWIAGVISGIPFLNILFALAGVAYMVYLMYIGFQPTMGIPNEKVAGMTVVSILIYIVLWVILFVVIMVAAFAIIGGGAMMAGAAASGM